MNPSLGSGSRLLGGAGPAMQALGQSGGVQGMQMQQTPASGGFNPDLQMAGGQVNQQAPSSPLQTALQTNGIPQHPLTGQPIPFSGVAPSQGVLEPKETEAQTILRAFETRLKHLSKKEQFDAGMA